MKAWRVTGKGEPADVLHLTEVPPPEPGMGEVQIAVGATGVGLPDVLMCRGEYLFSPSVPYTPGQEVAGTISAVSDDSEYQVGDRVLAVTAFYNGHGGFAEYCLAPELAVYPLPKGMPDAEAAGFGIPYHTAHVGLVQRGEVQAGETVLVLGAAGSSGSAAIQLGAALGADVIAVASSPEKRTWCKDIGAHHVIDGSVATWPEAVLSITDGRGVDVVYDPVGGEACALSLNCCAIGARILAVGFASGSWGAPSTEALVLKNSALVGVYVGAVGHEQMLDCHTFLSELYEAGKIASHIGERYGFDRVPEALTALARRNAPGKLVVEVSPD